MSRNVPLIINGSKCKSVSKEGITMIQETFAFDSLLQLVMSEIATHTSYREAIESCNDDIFKLTRSILKDGRLHPIYYTERAPILKNLSLFRDAVSIYTRGIKELNTNCNAEHFFINALSYVFVKSCTCSATNSRISVICNINIDILFHQGLQNMQQAIDDTRNITSKCQNCGALIGSIFKHDKI